MIEYQDDITRAARITAAKWPGVIDADDAEQEIWTQLLDNGGSRAMHVMDLDVDQRLSAF